MGRANHSPALLPGSSLCGGTSCCLDSLFSGGSESLLLPGARRFLQAPHSLKYRSGVLPQELALRLLAQNLEKARPIQRITPDVHLMALAPTRLLRNPSERPLLLNPPPPPTPSPPLLPVSIFKKDITKHSTPPVRDDDELLSGDHSE